MKIQLTDLRLNASIGIHPWEQDAPRQLIVQLVMGVEGDTAAQQDDIAHTVDYTAVEACLYDMFASRHWNLIETLAQRSAELLLQEFPLIQHISMTLEKPGALRFAQAVSVTVELVR